MKPDKQLKLIKGEGVAEASNPGIHSVKIDCLGDLRDISLHSKVSIARLVNFGCDLVRLVFCRDNVFSTAYNNISKKAAWLSSTDPETEFYLIRHAIDSFGYLVEGKENSVFDQCLNTMSAVNKAGGNISFPELIREAVSCSVNDPNFIKVLLNSKK